MKKYLNILMILITMIFIVSCKKEVATPTTSSSTFLINPGDIVVANGSRSIILLDSNGNYKQVLYTLDNVTETIYGLAWKADTREVMFTINGAARVGAISAIDGAYRNLITDINLTGALKGLTQLASGDILVAEVSNVERFSSAGIRKTLVNAVVWPNTLGATSTTLEQISATLDGGFIACSSGSDNVKRYTNNAVIVGTAQVSGIAGTTDAFGCLELANGRIAMAFNGTTDTIRTVSAAMTGITSIYSDLAILASPRTLTQAINGNILVVDSVYNQIVEITNAGTFVRTLGGGNLGSPVALFSVPNF